MNVNVIVKNMSTFIFSGMTGMMLSFFTGVYLARTLGAFPYGQISFALAVTTYFYFLADSGIGFYSTTKTSKDKTLLLETIETVYPLKFTISLIGFIILCGISYFFIGGENGLLVILYGLTIFPVAMAFDWVFQSEEKLRYSGIAKILYTGMMLLLVILFVKTPDQLLLIPVYQLMGVVASTILMLYLFTTRYQVPHFKFKVSEWKNILTTSLPYGITGSLTMLVWYVPYIVLQYTNGSESVGYFTAGDQLISAFIAIVGWYFYSLYPTLVKSKEDAESVQNYSARAVLGIMTPVCIGCILLAEQIMVFIYGSAYLPGVNLFILLTVSLWFLCLNQIYIFGLFSFDKQALTTKIFTLQCIGTIILCIILIPLYGGIGAALSAIGCELIALPFFNHEFRKSVKVNFSWIFSRAGIASLVMVVAIIVLKYFVDNLFLSIIVGGMVFLAAAYCLKIITKEDALRLTQRSIVS